MIRAFAVINSTIAAPVKPAVVVVVVVIRVGVRVRKE